MRQAYDYRQDQPDFSSLCWVFHRLLGCILREMEGLPLTKLHIPHSRDSSLFVPSHQSLVFLAMFPWKRRQERSLVEIYRKYIQKPGSLMISLLRVSSSGLSRVSLKERQERPSLLTHIAKKNSQSKRLSRKRKVNTPSLKPAWTIHVAATLFLLAHSPSSVILHRNEKKRQYEPRKSISHPTSSLPKSPLPAISHGLARSF